MVWTKNGLGASLAKRGVAAITAAVIAGGAFPVQALASQSVYENVAAPTLSARLAWSANLGDGVKASSEYEGMSFYNASDQLVQDGYLYIAVSDTLQRRDLTTGKVVAKAELSQMIGYFSRIEVCSIRDAKTGEDVTAIIVPEDNGVFEAFDISGSEIRRLWTSEAVKSSDGAWDYDQNTSWMYIGNGSLIAGTAVYTGGASDNPYGAGTLLNLNLSDGSFIWPAKRNDSAGYYWAGAVSFGEYVVTVDNAGRVVCLNSRGNTYGTLELGESVAAGCTTVAENGSSGAFFVMSRKGTLFKVSVSAGGALALAGKVSFGDYSVGRPTFADGLVFVGGAKFTDLETYSSAGLIAAVDPATMDVVASVSQLDDGSDIPGPVSLQPVVSVNASETDVFFTSNAMPGGVYSWVKTAAGFETAAHALYVPAPASQNYSQSNISLDASGNIYFKNDSATLFKVRTAKLGWYTANGKWHYAVKSSSGKIADRIGWTRGGTKSSYYYFDADGTMHKGWLKLGSAYYYFYSNGKMAVNAKVGSHYLGSRGAALY